MELNPAGVGLVAMRERVQPARRRIARPRAARRRLRGHWRGSRSDAQPFAVISGRVFRLTLSERLHKGETSYMSSLAEPGWEALARNPHFRELVASRRRFVAAGTAFYCAYFVAFLALLGFAPDFMAKEVLGISLALWGGLSICALTVVMAAAYARRAGRWERTGAARGRGGAAMSPRRHRRLQRARRRASSRVVLAITLVITRWAAKRTHSATEFYAAGRGVSGAANGIATAGDYLSAPRPSSATPGLMYLYGFDGWIIGLGACLSLPARALPARRADAQRGQVHGRRRARVPPARAAGARSPRRSTRC